MKIYFKPKQHHGDIIYCRKFLVFPLILDNEFGVKTLRWLEYATVKYAWCTPLPFNLFGWNPYMFIDDPETIKKVLK
jgi:hypothetical protein